MEMEFEIKAALDESVRERLGELDLTFGPPSVQEDVYFDWQDGQLYVRGIFLRLRNQHSMELKYTSDPYDDSHSNSVEHRYPWPLSPASERLLLAHISELIEQQRDLGTLQPLLTVRKQRSIAGWSNVTIALDDVEGLGTFVELEVAHAADVPQLRALMDALEVENVPVGYVELILRNQDFRLYAQGRFVLPEDLTMIAPMRVEVPRPSSHANDIKDSQNLAGLDFTDRDVNRHIASQWN